jgi:hypothetical protein
LEDKTPDAMDNPRSWKPKLKKHIPLFWNWKKKAKNGARPPVECLAVRPKKNQ